MQIGILETGAPPRALAGTFGRYDAMMAAMLGPGFDATTYRVRDGALPDSPESHQGYIVTGSAAGVHDGHPWIDDLVAFLRRARGRTRLVGICFGHQVMAEAFGGRVMTSDGGWGLGLHRYRVETRPDWLDDVDALAIPATHQDQVVEAPPGAVVVAGSDFAPLAALSYPDGSAISFQGHPEFAVPFARALLAAGHADRLGPAELARLSDTFEAPNDCARVGAAIGRFLRGNASGPAKALNRDEPVGAAQA